MGSVANQQSFLQKRVASIDALRGFDMFWITGGEAIIQALHKVYPGSATSLLNVEFHHVPRAGFHFCDLIFPLFLFVVGVVLPFSLTQRLEAGADRSQIYRHLVKRLARHLRRTICDVCGIECATDPLPESTAFPRRR